MLFSLIFALFSRHSRKKVRPYPKYQSFEFKVSQRERHKLGKDLKNEIISFLLGYSTAPYDLIIWLECASQGAHHCCDHSRGWAAAQAFTVWVSRCLLHVIVFLTAVCFCFLRWLSLIVGNSSYCQNLIVNTKMEDSIRIQRYWWSWSFGFRILVRDVAWFQRIFF